MHPYSDATSATLLQNAELHILKAGAPIYQDAKTEFYELTRSFLTTRLQIPEVPEQTLVFT